MESEGAQSLLTNAVTNFNLDCEGDRYRYEQCEKALGTQVFIAAVKELNEPSRESLSIYTRQELEEKYRRLSKQYRQAVIEVMEYRALVLALDTKMSLVAWLVEESFTRYVPQPESPALLFETCGVSSHHRNNTPRLRLIKK